MFLRSGFPFNYDTVKASDESGLKCPRKSRTQQSFRNECDINTIVKRFGLTGQLPSNVRMPTYQDFEGVFDFQSAMNQVIAAEKSFLAMPADVRARFGHDPQRFVEFCSDDKNREEAMKMGLVAVPAAPEPPVKVEVVGAPAAPPVTS